MVKNKLPAYPTPFIGRTEEVNELCRLLEDPNCRLLTLSGPGGIGKTRLVLEVARRVQSVYSDGIYFVTLQPLTVIDDIPSSVAETLHIQLDHERSVADQVLDYLAERHILLVLDNFEHLLAGAAFVASLLEVTSQAKLLVTSREPLNLQSEWVRQIRGMRVPDTDTTTSLDQYSALQLFAERARRTRGDFESGTGSPTCD